MAKDDTGITEVSISTGSSEITRSFDAESNISVDARVEGEPGAISTVVFQVTDQTQKTTEMQDDAYARQNTVPTPINLEIGTTYRLFQSYDPACLDASPEVGVYKNPDGKLVRNHVETLRGSGISIAEIRVSNRHQLEEASVFAETPLKEELVVQFRYDFIGWGDDGTPLDDQLNKLKDFIREHPYDRKDGRPVIVLPALESIGNRDAAPYWNTLLERFDGVEEVIQFIRDELTIEGTKPYLIGETSRVRQEYVSPFFYNGEEDLDILLRSMDAVQNGIRDPRFVKREDHANRSLEEDWKHNLHRRMRLLAGYAKKYGLEFVPRIAPGVVVSGGECPPSKRIPRDSDRFRGQLSYAARLATTERVNIESFNDWGMGTQIEAGSMLGEDYGTRYLTIVNEAVQQKPGETPVSRETHYVGSNGEDWQAGGESAPVASIQEGLRRAEPGDSVFLNAGEYFERVRTIRDGTDSNPITITGTPDATVRVPDGPDGFWIKNSHIKLTDIHLDGLLDPENPESVESYTEGSVLKVRPADTRDEYLENIHVTPTGAGNSKRALMVFQRTDGLDIGPMRITGLAGAEYNVGDLQSHVGEFFYLGQPPRVIAGREHEDFNWASYPWKGELDNTRNVRIHHIDNSEGHLHSEFVDAKTGTENVVIEYCTDAGGSNNTEPWNPCADIRFHSHHATLRWCDLRNGQARGIHIVDHSDFVSQLDDPVVTLEECGTDHSIYGNIIKGFGDKAMVFSTSASAQKVICGNEITGDSEGNPTKSCPSDVPSGDGIGHLGGESPWA